MEAEMIEKESVPFFGIYAGKLRRYLSIQNILDWFKIPLGIIQAWYYLGKIRPDTIFSKGGYVAVPVVIAASLRKIPIIIHESDVVPGLTTKLSSKFAKTICTSWKKTAHYFPGKHVVQTGVPIREEFMSGSREQGLQIAKLSGKKPTLLVVGGSLGAQAINDFVFQHKEVLLQSYDIIHITGKGKLPENVQSGPHYALFDMCGEEYIDIVAAADVILSRAGSTALAEFSAVQKKVLLIPLPTLGSRGDQLDNARTYTEEHPQHALYILQEEMSIEKVMHAFETLLSSKGTEKDSPQTALTHIIDIITAS